MIKRISIVFLLFIGLNCFSQNWVTNLVEAERIAQDKNQKIVLVFSGSDWCAPCIKLEKEILESKEFKDFSKSNFVMLRADFPRRKKNALPPKIQEENNSLAEMYNNHGFFPLVVVLDKNGKVLGETGYKNTTPKEYIKLLASY
ncbi:Thioredoxin Disulfide Isomerase [hydrothermal vent metagenome]|jgi:thioredoxin-related protein|uniref:Thioredoxin Disulfide Isomerase n=1 Tax=hydrothermal vent metagenome TaxID=652676 RepID=A0A3B0R3R6_9ZZZZ